MKALTHSLIAIFACAVLTLTGFAGPEPIRDYKDAKTVVPGPPRCDWRGFYMGMNAGYTWSENNWVDTVGENVFSNPAIGGSVVASAVAADLATFSLWNDNDAFIGGAQIGYNWQFGSWVAGVETDIQAVGEFGDDSVASSSSPVPGFPGISITQSAVVSRSVDYIGTARGRFGRLVTPCLLAYVTGGLAYGGVSGATGITQDTLGAPAVSNAYSGTGSFSETQIGWTVGTGIEWMFAPHWSVRSEYLYYDLGSVTYNVSPLVNFTNAGLLFTTTAPTSSTNFDGHIVRTALNFHF
jgi:outer membrane immunogenic protein